MGKWIGVLGDSVLSEKRWEASQGEYAAFLSKNVLIRALGVQGGAGLQPETAGTHLGPAADSAAIPMVPGGGFQVGSGGYCSPLGGLRSFSGLSLLLVPRGQSFTSLSPEAIGCRTVQAGLYWAGLGWAGLQATASLETCTPRPLCP